MSFQNGIKFKSLVEFWEYLPEDQRIITDVLRQIVLENLPANCIEKLTYNVPFYYGKRRICLIWPAAVPWGGFNSGVMLGFCQGNKLKDADHYLEQGTNKQIYYRIFRSTDEIETDAIVSILKEAVETDSQFK
jgi:Domain of unknown function (DU1801)